MYKIVSTKLQVMLCVPLLENMWTYHHTKPPNLTLGGFHMGQTIHAFIEWTYSIRLPLKSLEEK